MKRFPRAGLLAPLAMIGLAIGLAGCVAYPAPYGYYGGYYGTPAYNYAYAPPPVVGFNFGWWGGDHWGWGHWH